MYGKTIADANTALEAGWYRYGSICLNIPSDSYFQYGAILAVPRDNESINQIAFSEAGGYKSVLLAFRKTIDGGATFGEWEYLNPPMLLGVEYRTTERYLVKPVYAQAVDFGVLPNSTRKEVVIGSNSYHIIRAQATTSYGVLLTGTSENEHGASLRIRDNGIAIVTDTDQTTYTATVSAFYYKDTD